jgi:hypothetical protein
LNIGLNMPKIVAFDLQHCKVVIKRGKCSNSANPPC